MGCVCVYTFGSALQKAGNLPFIIDKSKFWDIGSRVSIKLDLEHMGYMVNVQWTVSSAVALTVPNHYFSSKVRRFAEFYLTY